MKTYILDAVQDQLIGKIGTAERDVFEYELQLDLIGRAIKQTLIANAPQPDAALFKAMDKVCQLVYGKRK